MSTAEWPHPHPKQPDTEDGPYTESMAMTDAVAELLIDKDVIGANRLPIEYLTATDFPSLLS